MRTYANNANKIIFAELSYTITGLCFKAQDKLGRFCREKLYADELEQLFKANGISYVREAELSTLNNTIPKGNKVDFLIEGIILLDVKAKPFIEKSDYYQVLRYLELSKRKLGLLVNFRNKYLKPKRILNSRVDSRHSHAFA